MIYATIDESGVIMGLQTVLYIGAIFDWLAGAWQTVGCWAHS